MPQWGDQQHSYSLKVFIVFIALGLPFPQVHLFVVVVAVGGGGGGGGAQQASSLSSKHKLWNFNRSCYSLHNYDMHQINPTLLPPQDIGWLYNFMNLLICIFINLSASFMSDSLKV